MPGCSDKRPTLLQQKHKSGLKRSYNYVSKINYHTKSEECKLSSTGVTPTSDVSTAVILTLSMAAPTVHMLFNNMENC
jgi:hypothetical protein